MNANELRIGNLVLSDWGEGPKITKITSGCDIQSIEENIDNWDPIILTEQWLIKCGFRDITEGYRATGADSGVWRITSPIRGQYIDLYEQWDRANWKVGGYFLAHFEYPMKYLHQLQNCIYAITGQELNINS